jgi:hypothetical protein
MISEAHVECASILRRMIMQSHGNSRLATAPIGWTFPQVREQAKRLGAYIVEFIEASAAAYAAAALHAELSRLSDAELERRGVPRGHLHRCVFEALDGPTTRSAPGSDAKK